MKVVVSTDKKCSSLVLFGRLALPPPRGGVPLESALILDSRMCPCGAHITHFAVQ